MKGSPKPWEWGGRGEKSKTGRETQRLGEALGLGVGKRAGLLSKPSGRRCWWDGGTPQPGGAPGAASVPCPPRASLGGGGWCYRDACRGVHRPRATFRGAAAKKSQASHCFLSQAVGKGSDCQSRPADRTALLHRIPPPHPRRIRYEHPPAQSSLDSPSKKKQGRFLLPRVVVLRLTLKTAPFSSC